MPRQKKTCVICLDPLDRKASICKACKKSADSSKLNKVEWAANRIWRFANKRQNKVVAEFLEQMQNPQYRYEAMGYEKLSEEVFDKTSKTK